MALATNAYAAAVAASAQNAQFQTTATVLARKILVIGTYLPAKSGITNYAPALVLSPTDAGNTYGFGSMIHRLVTGVFAGMNTAGGQVPVYVSPDSETNITGAAAASGIFAITGPATAAGTAMFYIDNIAYPVTVGSTDTATTVGANLVAAMAADPNCPMTGVNTSGSVAVTAKSKGIWGNYIPLAMNLGATDKLPTGITVAVTQPTAGAGANSTSIAAALAALGVGDSSNQLGFTDVVHGYHQDQLVITAIGTYGGLGNTPSGCYAPLVHRPFRCLVGDTVAGSTGFTNLQALSLANNQDRTNGVIWAPGSMTHPEEIAANAIGYMAVVNNLNAAQMYVGAILAGVDPGNAAGAAATRLTDVYANRVLAVGAGISPTLAQGSYLLLQNVVTFYAPPNVPAASNGYREMVNISKIQNILNNEWLAFSSPKWQGTFIVKDTTAVTDSNARAKARSLEDVRDEWVGLVTQFYKMGWIYSTDLPVKALSPAAQTPAITIRPAGDGFAASVPMILSGIGNVFDNTVLFDIAIPTS
jgi:phage tail sheath gpL-like